MYFDCNICRGIKFIDDGGTAFQLGLLLIYVNVLWLLLLGITANPKRELFDKYKNKKVSAIATVTERTSVQNGELTDYYLSYQYEVDSHITPIMTIEKTKVDRSFWIQVKDSGNTFEIWVIPDKPEHHISKTELRQLQVATAIFLPFSIVCGVLNLWRLQAVGWSLSAYMFSWISFETFLGVMVVNALLMCLGVALLCTWGLAIALSKFVRSMWRLTLNNIRVYYRKRKRCCQKEQSDDLADPLLDV